MNYIMNILHDYNLHDDFFLFLQLSPKTLLDEMSSFCINKVSTNLEDMSSMLIFFVKLHLLLSSFRFSSSSTFQLKLDF